MHCGRSVKQECSRGAMYRCSTHYPDIRLLVHEARKALKKQVRENVLNGIGRVSFIPTRPMRWTGLLLDDPIRPSRRG